VRGPFRVDLVSLPGVADLVNRYLSRYYYPRQAWLAANLRFRDQGFLGCDALADQRLLVDCHMNPSQGF